MEKIFHVNDNHKKREAGIAILISDKKTLKQRLYNKRQRRIQQLFSSDEPPEVEQFKKLCAPPFTAALFTLAKFEQPRRSSLRERIKKGVCVQCIQRTGVSLSPKRNGSCHLQQHGWTRRVLC